MTTSPTKERDPRTVQLKGVRLSFMDGLAEKKKSSDADDAKLKHSFNVIIESTSKHADENKAKIMAAIRAACDKKWKKPDTWKEIQEDNPKRIFFRKGEKFKSKETGEVYTGYAGNYAFGVSGPKGGDRRPKLFDRHKRPVADKDIPDVFYGGCYADIIVGVFGTDKGSQGVFATCEVIRSWQEGEPTGGGYIFNDDDLDEFDDFEDGDDLVGTSKDDDDDLLG